MFEFQVACRYLIPRKKSLATSLISLLSIFVISIVVWLVLVFLSVTRGIEANWLEKLTSLHAPIRIEPTPTYFSSYYYQIDRAASDSQYTLKTIGEKREALKDDPFSVDIDPELPSYWPKPDMHRDGAFVNPVKELIFHLNELQSQYPDLRYQDYEMAGALLRLNLNHLSSSAENQGTVHLSQMSYLLSFTDKNPKLFSLLISDDKTPLHISALPDVGSNTPVFLPKSYIDSGAKIGDVGSLSYITPSAGVSQEQHIRIQIAGFYDPGIMPIGNKCILVPSSITRTILTSTQTFSPDGTPTNGIFVWIHDLKSAKAVKEAIETTLKNHELASFWKVTTFEEFEFSRDLFSQFQSDRTLFLMIATIVIIVACCNVISLLVLLVNDKRKEIAVLVAMGSKKYSIALIFAYSGIIMGTLGSLLGTLAAYLTLKNLKPIVSLISSLQGKAILNPLFFGDRLPTDLSQDALIFVFIITPILSLVAGLIPALKASKTSPSSILRSE